MKKLKYLIPITLVITALVTLVVITSMSVNAETEGCFTYTVSGGKATITAVDTSISGDVTIPEALGGYPVTSIGYAAFRGCSSITSIVIPDSVTNIDNSTFYGCSSLTSINIPDGVTEIDAYAFYECDNLTNINIPDGVTRIGNNAFSGCNSLTSIVIPNGVTIIAGCAFQECSNLTSIVMPNSVRTIDYRAFFYCNALTTVYYQGTQSDWDTISIKSENGDLTGANIIYGAQFYTINVYATPEEGGTAEGAGEHLIGTIVTLTATANEGYIFEGWYENGELVSADATITFIAEADRTLTAKFAPETPEFIYGDVNGDGQINIEDVILLRQYIANYNYETGSSTVVLGPQQ